jgi:hypothetical protein
MVVVGELASLRVPLYGMIGVHLPPVFLCLQRQGAKQRDRKKNLFHGFTTNFLQSYEIKWKVKSEKRKSFTLLAFSHHVVSFLTSRCQLSHNTLSASLHHVVSLNTTRRPTSFFASAVFFRDLVLVVRKNFVTLRAENYKLT